MQKDGLPLSRRDLLAAGGVATIAGGASPGAASAETNLQASLHVDLVINGQKVTAEIDPRSTLLDLLRETIQLTATKKGCDHGQCGACTVHIGGQAVLSCLTLAAAVDGEITTLEGLSDGKALHPMQQAFLDHDAFQCGYCTPGQIMSAVALAKSDMPMDKAHIREAMSGNLCRCSAYPQIVSAVEDGARRMRRG
ncbi:MAG: (2Fe-2S)-binding protein [Sphingobium sp.]